MAWTAPMTAVAGAAFTAAQFNTYIRDNLMETAPAKATQSGSFFVGAGPNQIVERVPTDQMVAATQTTSSTNYTDLATAGPTITLETGAKALVSLVCKGTHNMNNGSLFMSLEVSGATDIEASDDYALQHDIGLAENNERKGISYVVTLNPGLNTFTCKYRVHVGTGTFWRRQLSIIPF